MPFAPLYETTERSHRVEYFLRLIARFERIAVIGGELRWRVVGSRRSARHQILYLNLLVFDAVFAHVVIFVGFMCLEVAGLGLTVAVETWVLFDFTR